MSKPPDQHGSFRFTCCGGPRINDESKISCFEKPCILETTGKGFLVPIHREILALPSCLTSGFFGRFVSHRKPKGVSPVRCWQPKFANANQGCIERDLQLKKKRMPIPIPTKNGENSVVATPSDDFCESRDAGFGFKRWSDE